MKQVILFLFFMAAGLSLSAQCFEYRSEMGKIETLMNAATRNLKKACKSQVLEEAQQLVDKSIAQAEVAMKTINFVKEYAGSCQCEEGEKSAENILGAINDFRNLCQKTADSGSIEELRDSMTKNLEFADSVLNEIAESLSLCMVESSEPQSE